MIRAILEFLQEIALRHDTEVIMAWVQYIPAAISGLSAGIGALSQSKKNREMRGMVGGWQAENEAMFTNDYNKDYTQTQEAQNIIKQMRDLNDREAKREQNTAVITGGTVEAQAAAKERRNRAMSDLFGNLGAMGTRYKERAKDRYLNRKNQLQGIEYGQLAQEAESAGNLMSNGLSGLAGMDWAGIMGGGTTGYNPSKGLGSKIPGYSEFMKNNPLQ